jgi:phosphopantothenoylcysteine decarboxylase/phosphopantothenate--cysteine ligase
VGRVAEPDDILEAIERLLVPSGMSRSILVTAGGTREPVDPVRFLGNRSSGKMGHAIANEAARRGMSVTLVTTSDLTVLPSVKVVPVETAQEMLDAVSGVDAEIAVMAAAVADFRPASPATTKLARSEGLDSIQLEPNPDILASLAAREPRPYLVGFAAETGGVDRAIEKAKTKGVDLLVYNDVTETGSGFGTDTNRVVVIDPTGQTDPWPVLSKEEVAARLLDRIVDELEAKG